MSHAQDIIVTVDVVILTINKAGLSVLLSVRPRGPYENRVALPGGFVRTEGDESAEAAAMRVLSDKVGVRDVHIEQLRTFSGPDRDPRGYSVSIAYMAFVPPSAVPDDALLLPVRDVSGLAFDHDEILTEAVERLRRKASYSSVPAALIEAPFTLPELYAAYAEILGMTPDPSSFRRKVLAVGAISSTGESKPRKGKGKGGGGLTYRLPHDEVRTFDITFKASRA